MATSEDVVARYKTAIEAKLRAIEEKAVAITERDAALVARDAARAEVARMSKELDELRMRRDRDKDLIADLRTQSTRFGKEVKDLEEAFKVAQAAMVHVATRVKSVVGLVCPDLGHRGSPIHGSLKEDLSANVTLPRPKLVGSMTVSRPKPAWSSLAHLQRSSIYSGQESPGQPTGIDEKDFLIDQDALPPNPPLPVRPGNGSHDSGAAPVIATKPRPPSAVREPLGLHSRAERIVCTPSGMGAQGSRIAGSGSVPTVRSTGKGLIRVDPALLTAVPTVRSGGKGLIRVDPALLTAGLKRKPSFTDENLASSKKPKQASNQGTSAKKVN